MIVSKENIASTIPQREPFIMVSELIYSDDKLSRSRMLVGADNIFVANGKLREPGLLENIAQTAAARAGYESFVQNTPVQIGYIGAVKNFEVYSLPAVNDVLDTEVVIQNQIFDVTLVTGTIKQGDKLLAQCEMKIFIPSSK